MNKTLKKQRGSVSLEKKQARYGYFFILPLIFGCAFLFIPNIIQTFIFTLNKISLQSGGYSLDFVGLSFYKNALFVDAQFRILLVSNIGSLISNVVVIVIFSLFIASVLNQRFRGRIFARVVFFIPVLLATGIIAKIENSSNLLNALETSRMLNTGTSMDYIQFTAVNDFLTSLNFSEDIINVVKNAAGNIYGVVLSSGIQIFIFLAGLQEIPDSLYEAAKVEGCSGWELFWKITFPIISPQIIVNVIYTIVDTFTKSDSTFFSYTRSLAFAQNQYSLATAMNWLYFMCLSVILIVTGLILSRFVFYNE